MHVLVCGSRNYSDRARVFSALDDILAQNSIDRVVHGAATGADTFGQEWAVERGIHEEPYEADWDRYDNYAGNVRNQKMLNEESIDLVVAFGTGQGTRDMVGRAKTEGIAVERIS